MLKKLKQRKGINVYLPVFLISFGTYSSADSLTTFNLYNASKLDFIETEHGGGSFSDINDFGMVVGSSGFDEWEVATLWNSSGVAEKIGVYNGSGHFDGAISGSRAQAINNNGQVVGFSYTSGGSVGWKWSRETGTEIIELQGNYSSIRLTDINDSGVIVGSFTDGEGSKAFAIDSLYGEKVLWDENVNLREKGPQINDNGLVVGTNDDPNSGGYAGAVYNLNSDEFTQYLGYHRRYFYGLNDHGFIAGTSLSDSTKAAVFSSIGQGKRILEKNEHTTNSSYYLYSMAYDINNQNQIVGQAFIENGRRGKGDAAIWNRNGTLAQLDDLVIEDVDLYSAISISNKGQILSSNGYVLTPSGDTVDYISYASAVPEPSTYALMLGGLGLVGFMAARRRKQA